MNKIKLFALTTVLAVSVLAGLNQADVFAKETGSENVNSAACQSLEETRSVNIELIAKTLSGECYDDKETDKRLVCEVILNRVSDSRFPDTVYGVVSAKYQFMGFYNQSRAVSDSDYRIAEEMLNRWLNNNCNALSDIFYFSAGNDRENKFRKNY